MFKKKKVYILGTGMVGSAIAFDLSSVYQVIGIDKNPESLKLIANIKNIITLKMDVTDLNQLHRAIANADLVINALPGNLGFNVLKSIIEAKKDVIDISFSMQDHLILDDLAVKNGVTAVVDCGIAPGLCNIILGYENTDFSKISSYRCYIGGVPRLRSWPFEYKAVYSPIDVLEVYTREARIKQNGKLVTKPALSDLELIEFENIGTLEAFNTDGLRTLLSTIPIPNMVEKTLRYPGHAEIMKIFQHSGFFSREPVTVKGYSVIPVELTAKLLHNQWKLQPNEQDITIMKIVIEGTKNLERKKVTYLLLDYYDTADNITSMARTTGFTATAVATLLLNGTIEQKGIIPPEYIGIQPELFSKVIEYLSKRNINLKSRIEEG